MDDEARVPSSDNAFSPSCLVGDCCETSTTNRVSGATYADDVAYGNSLRRRRMWTTLIITMPIKAMPPTTPPTITPVSEVRSRLGVGEGDDVGYMERLGGYIEGVTIRSLRAVFGGEVMFPRIALPGNISGSSKTHWCEAAERKTEKGTPTTDGQRFVGVPIILRLAYPFGSCWENNKKRRTVTSMRAH
jgi:hypothetical protein